MSKDQNSGNAAKNRGAGAGAANPADGGLNIPTLNIPTLGGGTPDPAAAAQGSQNTQATGQERGGAEQDGEQLQQQGGQQPSMADIQRMADAAAKPQQAMHRPTFMRNDREQGSDTPVLEMEMPITGSLDNMRRPDQYIEPVTDFGRFKDKAAELAFLEEMVMIRIHESGDPTAEPLVQLGVNGRQIFVKRGEDVFVRRKYVEQLLRAKPEHIQTNIRRDGDGNVRNMISKTRALKYPFSIIRDDNPMGRAWERKIRAEA